MTSANLPLATAPRPQNAIDLFAGQWVSKLPAAISAHSGGTASLFEDDRVAWANEELTKMSGRGVAGRTVLELGPLEGGHTFSLSQLGAKEIVAVEANALAYLKCLVAKETVGIPNAKFLLGDILGYLREEKPRFDFGFACGILYHMTNPVELIGLLSDACDTIYLWTVVFDDVLFLKQPDMLQHFRAPVLRETRGFQHVVFPHHYGSGYDDGKFLGGTEASSCWMRPEAIVDAFTYFGFDQIKTKIEENPFGKVISILAVRS